ncbi:MAG TPA: ABC transporter substrate-binding protein [Pirellulales bacterium]|nr:ABC transporter substrate-binding protein [Pirellulales bacterium]
MNVGRWWPRVVGLALVALTVALGVWRAKLPVRATDGRASHSAAPQRIASLTLGSDEMLAALVPAERVVCVTSLADDPEISNVPGFFPRSVARLGDAAAERIVGMNPDLVCVASYNSADSLEVLRRSGLALYQNEACQSIDEIEAGLLAFGQKVGEPNRAAEVVRRMRERRRRLADRLGEIPDRPRVLFWSAGFTAGRKTTLDDIIREAGGSNVAVERGWEGSAEISPEQVIAAAPTFVLQLRWSADAREGRIEGHPLLRDLPAVRENRVIAIEGKYLSTVSHHVVEGVERLARKLHPDRFLDDEPSSQPTDEG